MKISHQSLLFAAALVLGSPLPQTTGGSGSPDLGNPTSIASGPPNAVVQNKESYYLTTLQIGTPAQSQQAIVDTGSSDLWVFGGPSGNAGAFNTSLSSTYKLVSKGGFQTSNDDNAVTGDWATDSVGITRGSVTSQVFGVANRKSGPLPYGVFGVGLAANEAASASAVGGQYANFPASLKKAGLVKRNAFSLYVNSEEAKTGSILFGALDTAKFTAPLNTVPLQSSKEFAVTFDFYGERHTGVLDSGSTALVVPYTSYTLALADLLLTVPNIRWDILGGTYYVAQQSDIPANRSLKIAVGGVTYDIWLRNLFAQTSSNTNDKNYYLQLQPTGSLFSAPSFRLGLPFLRSVYVVFDLNSSQVAIAPAKYTSDSSITVIPAGGIGAIGSSSSATSSTQAPSSAQRSLQAISTSVSSSFLISSAQPSSQSASSVLPVSSTAQTSSSSLTSSKTQSTLLPVSSAPVSSAPVSSASASSAPASSLPARSAFVSSSAQPSSQLAPSSTSADADDSSLSSPGPSSYGGQVILLTDVSSDPASSAVLPTSANPTSDSSATASATSTTAGPSSKTVLVRSTTQTSFINTRTTRYVTKSAPWGYTTIAIPPDPETTEDPTSTEEEVPEPTSTTANSNWDTNSSGD